MEETDHVNNNNLTAEPSGAGKNVSFNEDDDNVGILGDPRYQAVSSSFAPSPERRQTFASMQLGKSDSGAALNQSDTVGRLRRDTAIPLDFVINHVKLSLDAGELYKDLVIFIPFLVMFVFFFLYGRQVESNFFILKAIRDQTMLTEFPRVETQLATFRDQVLNEQRLWVELDKTFDGIGNVGDWRDYVNDVLLETIWDAKNPDVAYQMRAPYGQIYHIGALRLRAIRMKEDSCSVVEELYPSDDANFSKFPRTCYAKHDRKKEDKSRRCNATYPLTGEPMMLYHEYSDVPGVTISAVEGVYHSGGHIVEIPFNISYNDARAILQLATDPACSLVDNWGTRFVVAEYFVYTPQTDSFHGIKLYQEVLSGGWWYNQFMFRSFSIWTPQRVSQTIFEFAFLVFVMYYWVAFFYDLVVWYKRGGSILKFFTEFWNILEMVNLVTFVAVFILRWIWWRTSSNAQEDIRFPFPARYPDHLDRLMGLYGAQVYANSVNTILTFLKLLKYVRLNARLSVLTRTIAMCQQSILGVLVLFVFVIVGYGITAWTLFGINIEGFRNLGVSMSSLVRMLVGDIDYEAMRRENRFLAGAFFWTFIILALFLLLNFLIAIISEAFAKISGKAYSQSLDETLLRMYQHLKAVWSPTNIKRIWRGFRSGKSEAKMMRVALQSLMDVKEAELKKIKDALELRRSQQQADGGNENQGPSDALDYLDYDEIAVMMMRSDWKSWLDEETYEAMGDFYFDYTWDDIMNEYDDAKKSSEEVGKRHMMETVQNGVKKVVGDELKKVDQLDEMLTSLETEVGSIIDALRK